MRYHILNYKYNKDANQYSLNKKSKRIRHIDKFTRVELVSDSKIKGWDADMIVSEFESDQHGSVDIFESYIKQHFDLFTWEEEQYENDFYKADNLAIDLLKYLEQDLPKSHTMVNRKSRIVYFLWRDSKVVYVGQSKSGLSRPYEHTDKEWDQLSYVEVDETHNLSLIEMFFIRKYKPEYNKSYPLSKKMFDMAIVNLKKIIKDNERV
tara:strand:+ start:54 stop:677 length:624 start_codon:yes stop_codon:yes gene_type:complete